MNQNTAPFKFLDAYSEFDHDVFFGRDAETEALYDALNGVKHLLVYGPSGAGKTSLIECGLRNQFSDVDWHAITIRRRDNINTAIFDAINKALDNEIPLDASGYPVDAEVDFGHAIEQLFDERYQPIYLLFDQFEELLLLAEQEEKVDFFTRLHELIRYRVPCRVLIIMREEFIGHLSEFEHLCPSIFKHRFRLEKMGRSNVRQVIYQILEAPEYEDDFQVAESEALAETILSKLPDQKKEIELTHVQVFLSELWDRANANKKEQQLPILSKNLIREEDNLESVLDAFLKKQMRELEQSFGEKVPLELLAAMISERHTKLQVTESELAEALKKEGIILQQPIPNLLEALENRRIIRTLKTGEEARYEISHDLLAYVVGQNLTEEMQLREKANDIYRVYAERQGYFSQEDLDYLRPFEQYKDYPKELEERITQSEFFWANEEEKELRETKKRLRTVRILLTIAAFGVLAAIGVGIFGFQKARLAGEETLRANEEALRANKQTKVAEKKTDEAKHNADRANLNAKIAKKQSALADAARNRAERARENAISNQRLAQKALENIEQKNNTVIELALGNVKLDLLNLNYDNALKKIEYLIDLNPNHLQVSKAILELVFWQNEIGNHEKAFNLLNDFAQKAELPLSIAAYDSLALPKQQIRYEINKINPTFFSYLFKEKYYPKMVFIKGGTFLMGCNEDIDFDCENDEKPHSQSIDNFQISQFEITRFQYFMYCKATNKKYVKSTSGIYGDNPISNVTWFDAIFYANWVSSQLGLSELYVFNNEQSEDHSINNFITSMKGFRLPTEAEWEYAAKGGIYQNAFLYSGDSLLSTVAWFDSNSGGRTHKVGSKQPNNLNIYDLSGNVWEWCWDSFAEYPDTTEYNYWYSQNGRRVLRGGSYKDKKIDCRTSYRLNAPPDEVLVNVGFRLVLSE